MEIQPSGWLDGMDTPGNLGGVADVSPPGDMISQIMINWGELGIEYNFGELLPGSIAGRVADLRRRRAAEAENDVPIPGVQVDLLNRRRASRRHNHVHQRQWRILFHEFAPGNVQRSRASADAYFDDEAHVGSGGGDHRYDHLLGEISISSGEHRD